MNSSEVLPSITGRIFFSGMKFEDTSIGILGVEALGYDECVY
jgi:hypothetical protein